MSNLKSITSIQYLCVVHLTRTYVFHVFFQAAHAYRANSAVCSRLAFITAAAPQRVPHIYVRIARSTTDPAQEACTSVPSVSIARHRKLLLHSAGQAFGRRGQASLLCSQNHAAHARARMQNEARAQCALCRREEVVLEERQVDLGLISALGALEIVLGTRESEWAVSCALGMG